MKKHVLSDFAENVESTVVKERVSGPTILTETIETSDPDGFTIDEFE